MPLDLATESARLSVLLDEAAKTSASVDRVFSNRMKRSSPPAAAAAAAAELPAQLSQLQDQLRRLSARAPSPPNAPLPWSTPAPRAPSPAPLVASPPEREPPSSKLLASRTERTLARLERERASAFDCLSGLERENDALRRTCEEQRRELRELRAAKESSDTRLELAQAEAEAREGWAVETERAGAARGWSLRERLEVERMDEVRAEEQHRTVEDLRWRLREAEAERERLRTMLMGVSW